MSGDAKVKPAGRSYDGHAWEAVQPTLLEFDCDLSERAFCTVTLPADESDGGAFYLLRAFNHTLTPEQAASRLLVQASFGPTRVTIDGLVATETAAAAAGGDGARDWFAAQMALPPTLHRAWFRRRANTRLAHQPMYSAAYPSSPTDVGSRWHRFAFTEEDIGKTVVVADANADAARSLTVDGEARAEIDGATFDALNASGASQPYVSRRPPPPAQCKFDVSPTGGAASETMGVSRAQVRDLHGRREGGRRRPAAGCPWR